MDVHRPWRYLAPISPFPHSHGLYKQNKALSSPRLYSITGSIPQPKGSGSRHIRISDESIPIAPNGTSPTANPRRRLAAAETLTPSVRFSRYIYVSTRDTGVQTPAGDSIAIFENVGQGTPEEKLQLVTRVFAGLD
ncbi:hypothetical protein DFH08DRAFT_1035388 [Mycena albidolilacea]|uniref:Uncharacterized protein n=1 Tax=Mycena albidolilacea TaxID=1033008 RepID=A0AAD6ZEA1_9AGAR|nr:hypothetical protein DFH08DRAFT_1035388 [Mycena albidolilacea]